VEEKSMAAERERRIEAQRAALRDAGVTREPLLTEMAIAFASLLEALQSPRP
jgi:hypothetical protein